MPTSPFSRHASNTTPLQADLRQPTRAIELLKMAPLFHIARHFSPLALMPRAIPSASAWQVRVPAHRVRVARVYAPRHA